MSLKGDLSSLKKFASNLRTMPKVVAQKVAATSSPKLTDTTRLTFAAGQDPYGVAWAPSRTGDKVTLVASGALAKALAYTSTGTIIRLKPLPAYAKYQIGKRRVAPAQGGALPPDFRTVLVNATNAVIRQELSR